MLVLRQHRIYRKDIQANPNVLYIFGDNLDREGMGGQAYEMRGEPNSFGIATKRAITHGFPEDYLFDTQESTFGILMLEFDRLENTLILPRIIGFETSVVEYFGAVVIPMDGIGTGLSKMPEHAPKALEYIEKRFKQLETL